MSGTTPSLPQRKIGVYTRRDSRGATLIEGYIDAYETNEVGAFIWARCDGENTVPDIAAELATACSIDGSHALTTTEAFVAGLVELGFLESD